MIISHRLKYVFIHVPKTGGTSVRNILTHNDKFSCDVISHWDTITEEQFEAFPKVSRELKCHHGVRKAKEYFDDNDLDWDSYFKFCFMRNPYDLHVSYYHFLDQVIGKKERNTEEQEETYQNATSFPDYVKDLERSRAGFQEIYIRDEGEVKVDFIGKLETIEEDFKHIVDTILPKQIITEKEYKLPFLNKTEHKHFSEYYTPELTNLVNKACEMDFKVGGYKMS